MSTTAVATTKHSPPTPPKLPPALDLTEERKVIEAALAALVTKDNAVFEPPVIAALGAVRTLVPPAYAEFRTRAKQTNPRVSVVELDRLTRPDEDPNAKPLDQLVALATAKCVLSHDADRRGVAVVECETHREVWLVRGTGFSNWLRAEYFHTYSRGVPKTALIAAVTTIEAIGVNMGEEVEVHVRCAKTGESYVLDMCDPLWRAIQVDKSGYAVLGRSPVLFTRSEQMRSLPTPANVGDLNLLWKHANVPPQQQPLVVAWLLDSMRPDTPFPVLELTGEQGSAKSSTQRALRNLVDPNKVLLRGAPKSVQDIYIAAANNWVVSYENLSELSVEEQDALCTLSTGGGFATRRLYTDGDENLLKTKRPVILNGIAGVATRPDLIERTVRVDSPTIPPSGRRTDMELERAWAQDYPLIFAALLERFASTQKALENVTLAKHERMADFERLGEALMRSAGSPPGSFSEIYAKAVREGAERGLECYGVAQALVQLMEDLETKGRSSWIGTVGGLLKAVNDHGKDDRSNWPKSPRGMSDQLKRLASGLRGMGLEITLGQKSNKGREVSVTKLSDGMPNAQGRPEEAADQGETQGSRVEELSAPPSEDEAREEGGESLGKVTE